MAIAYDAIGAGGATASPGNSITYSHTVTGSNTGLVVYIMTGDVNGGAATITDVTYNGSSGVAVESRGPTGGRKMDLWKKTACATGTNNVVISIGNSTYSDANSISYTGTNQSDMEDTSTNNTASTTLTLTVTTTADNCWLTSGASDLGTGPATAGTGSTSRGTCGAFRFGDSNGAKTPAGSHSMGWTGSGTVAGMLMAIAPSVASSAVKTAEGLAIASVKTGEGLAIASIKTWGGLA